MYLELISLTIWIMKFEDLFILINNVWLSMERYSLEVIVRKVACLIEFVISSSMSILDFILELSFG